MEKLLNESTNFQHSHLLRMRCPECLKLYFTDSHGITQRRPKFQCQSCKMKFWVAYPESLGEGEILGYPLDWIEPNNSTSHTDISIHEGFAQEFHQTSGMNRVQGVTGSQKEKKNEVVSRKFRGFTFIGLFFVGLTIVGVVWPELRNLVGIGVAGLFLCMVMVTSQ